MASLEIFDRHGRFGERKELAGDRVTVGRDEGCTVVVEESTVSRTHALLEPAGLVRWTILDLGSANGTKVNGERLFTEQVLADGDNIQIGRIRVVYHNAAEKKGSKTEPLSSPPRLTRREYQVLLELVRPILAGSVFTEPASVAEIAARLFVGEGAVKNHLLAMYQKFDIEEGSNRRRRLAEAAIERGAVNFSDYSAKDEDSDEGS